MNNSKNLGELLDYIKNNQIENSNVLIKQGDIFTAPDHYALAHCVSRDLKMRAGIAQDFREKFGHTQELLEQNCSVGEVATLQVQKRNIYYLITKENYYEKPTYDVMWKVLVNLRTLCLENGES